MRAAISPSLVIDLGGVEFCDSSGLGAPVAIWRAIRGDGGKPVLARPQDRLRALLALRSQPNVSPAAK